MNIGIFKTIIFFIIVIYIVTYINKNFVEIFDVIQDNTKKNLTTYPQYIYIYIPLMFFIASKANLFQYADGFFELYIQKMGNSVNNHKTSYSKASYFIGIITIISIYIFALLSTASACALGNEDVVIYSSICLLMYFYFKFKNIIGLKEVYTELLIYLGYAIGLLIGYGSMLSTFIYIIEHMVVNKDINFFSNIGPIVFAIPFIYYLVGEKENLIKIDNLSFKLKSFGYIALFSVLMGVISFLFLKSINFMFNTIKKSKFNNLYVIGFGFILAFILKKNGFISLKPSQQYINEEFQASINREKLKKLEEENNYDELEKLKKLENQGKFNTDNKFNLTFLLTRLVNCATGLSAGLIGGFIIPSITIGCMFGSVLSEYTNVSQKNLMFLGMIAFLSPFLGTPITSALLVNKISNQKYDLLPLSIAVSFISYFTYTLLKKRFF